MTEQLADRLSRLADRGPHADPRLVVARANATAYATPFPDVPSTTRSNAPKFAAAFLAAAAVAGIVVVATRDPDAGPPAQAPSTDRPTPTTSSTQRPAETLPSFNDLTAVPITVPAGSALQYWRFAPDVDIAERATSGGSSELCWRSTAGQGYIDDTFQSPNVGVIPIAGGAIALARPSVTLIQPAPVDPMAPKFETGPDPTTITVQLSDGSSRAAKVEHLDTWGVGYSRFDLPNGVTIISASSR